MIELEVNCVQRAGSAATHHTITHLGHQGFACRIPVELVIQQIRGKLNLYYTLEPDSQQRIYIGVRREAGRCPYLQAQVEGVWTDHLLLLPECRPHYRVIKDGVASESRRTVRFMVPR